MESSMKSAVGLSALLVFAPASAQVAVSLAFDSPVQAFDLLPGVAGDLAELLLRLCIDTLTAPLT